MKTLGILLLLILLDLVSIASAGISGTFNSVTGEKLSNGHISIIKLEDYDGAYLSVEKTQQTYSIDKSGKYSIHIAEKTPLVIIFSSPGYYFLTTIIFRLENNIVADVWLKPFEVNYNDSLILLTSDKGYDVKRGILFSKDNNEFYVLLDSNELIDSFSYCILNLTQRIRISGNDPQDLFRQKKNFPEFYDGYISKISKYSSNSRKISFITTGGITSADSYVKFNDSFHQKVSDMFTEVSGLLNKMRVRSRSQGMNIEGDIQSAKKNLESILRNDLDQTIKSIAYVSYARLLPTGIELDTSLCRKAFTDIDASSYAWGISPWQINDLARCLNGLYENPELIEYFKKVLLESKVHETKQWCAYLLAQVYAKQNKWTDFEKNKSILRKLYPLSRYNSMIEALDVQNSKIRKELPAPGFELSDLFDPGRTVTNNTFKDSIYLIDFWATWCIPCIQEIPVLLEAHKKFHKQGLSIISISIDNNRGDVIDFLKKRKITLPWIQTISEGGYESPIAKSYEITYIPRPILVGKNGKIISNESKELRGENLIGFLDELFNRVKQ